MNNQLGLKKIFLIIFHGGMVAYLILHNLLIPMVRNFGAGSALFSGVHYWFVLHLFVLFLFIQYDFHKKEKSLIPVTIWTSIYATILGTIELFYSLGVTKVNVGHFSSFISVACIGIFYIGFFIYFKTFINWKTEALWKRHALAIGLGLLHFGIQMNIEDHVGLIKIKKVIKLEKEKVDYSEFGCKGSIIHLSKSVKPKSMDVIISGCGFVENLSAFKGKNINLINNSGKKHLVRFERLDETKWKLVRPITIRDGDKFVIRKDNFHLKGIYRLRSPTSKAIGIHLIVNDDIEKALIINPKGVQ
ncbi:MAG: hypothetical protein ACO2ZP_13535 [Bacteriovoracaceae bacterium]